MREGVTQIAALRRGSNESLKLGTGQGRQIIGGEA